MASTIIKTSSRYPSFDSRSSASSHPSDISFSTELKTPAATRRRPPSDPAPTSGNSSSALARTKSTDLVRGKKEQNFSSMVKKFVERRSKPKADRTALIIPVDFIAEDLKKTGSKGSNFSAFPKKLFQKAAGSSGKKDRAPETKALTEVRPNTRTLAMVLRSERELLSQNKEQEALIGELQLMLEGKNREVEKLKDLCLKQREEIKALKSAILFPDVMNSQLHELVEKQGSELKQAKQVIPALQKQVTSLTGQLRCLAEDLAEVKADKYAVKTCFDGHVSSPRTPIQEQEAMNSLEFSSGDPVTPIGSPDDMFLKDLNPCLTPYYAKTKSKEYEEMVYDSLHEEGFSGSSTQTCLESFSSSHSPKLSKSSEYCERRLSVGSATARLARKSDESKCKNWMKANAAMER